MRYDKVTGDPVYYNNKGDYTHIRPKSFAIPNSIRQTKSFQKPPVANKKPSHIFNGASPRKGSWLAANRGPKLGTDPKTFSTSVRNVNPASRSFTKKTVGTPLRVNRSRKPSAKGELTLKKGDVFVGIQKQDNWWLGEVNGKRGMVPVDAVGVSERTSKITEEPIKKQDVQSSRRIEPEEPKPNSGPRFDVQSSIELPEEQETNYTVKPNNMKPLPKPQILKDLMEKTVPKSNTLQYTLLAHNYGYAFSFLSLVSGLISITWYEEYIKNTALHVEYLYATEWISIYACAAGGASFLYETFFGLKKNQTTLKLVGGLYLGVSFPMIFGSYLTIPAGLIGFTAGYLNMISDVRNEIGTAADQKYLFRCKPSTFLNWSTSQLVIMILYSLALMGLFAYRFIMLEMSRHECEQLETKCLSIYGSFAKGFGTWLDLACAVVLFPVMRGFLQKIYESQGGGISKKLSLKKNIHFHKVVGFTIAIGTVGHVVAHMLNFAASTDAVVKVFGPIPLLNGVGILLALVVLLCGAQDAVRRANYEVFFYSHRMYIPFFTLLLSHAPKLWIYFGIPMIFFTIDKIYRRFRSKKKMYVDSVRYYSPVLSIRFFPEQLDDFVFREGQYLYLKCPTISGHQWHPFTISSALGDLEKEGYVSIHIRVQKPGSWTHKVYEYFKMLSGETGSGNFEEYFYHYDAGGQPLVGKYIGPNGLPLIQIDGPHAAPAQEYSTFKNVMLVGSGIGLTPSAAILSGITKYKWSKGFQPEVVSFCWVVRHSEIDSFMWFIEFLHLMSVKINSDRLANAITDNHKININIYVTSVTDQNREPGSTVPDQRKSRKSYRSVKYTQDSKAGFGFDIGFTLNELYRKIKNPTVSASDQFSSAQNSNKLQDISIWNGRPNWERIFLDVKQTRQKNVAEIGVCYCGAPVIGNDLKKACRMFSNPQDCEFVLNKEIF